MYCKVKNILIIICLLFFCGSVNSKSLFEKFKDLISFDLPKDIFSSINQDIVGKLQAKNIRFLLPNKIEVDGIEILDERGGRVLYSKHVKLTISLLSLLTKNIKITDAVVDSPFFDYSIKKDVHNIVRVFDAKKSKKPSDASSSSSSDTRITIQALKLLNGSFEMHHDAGVQIFADQISAEGKFFVAGGPFEAEISKLTVESGGIIALGMDFPLNNLVASDLFISDKKVHAKDLTANYDRAKVSATGTVFIDDEHYDLHCKIDAPRGTYPAGLKPLFFTLPAFKADILMLGTLREPEFLTDVDFSSTDINGLPIKQGKASVQINTHQVILRSGELKAGEKGRIFVSGDIDIDKKDFRFQSSQKSIFVHELAKFLEFPKETQGTFWAQSKFEGSYAGDTTFSINSKGQITDGAMEQIKFPGQSSFDFNGILALKKSLKINPSHLKNEKGLNLSFSGKSDLANKFTTVDYNLFCANVGRHISVPKDAIIDGVKSHGQMVLDTSPGVSIKGRVSADALQMAKLQVKNITSGFHLNKNKLNIEHLSAKSYDGTIFLDLVIDKLSEEKALSGNINIENVNLEKLSQSLKSINLGGNLSAALNIEGTVESPSVYFSSNISDLVLDKIAIPSMDLEGRLHEDVLNISKLSSNSISASIDGQNIFYNLRSKKIGGEFFVAGLDISSMFLTYGFNIDGYLHGSIFIGGTINSPTISAPLIAHKLVVYGLALGSGALTLSLEEQNLLGRNKEKDLVFSVSTNLFENKSTTLGRFSYALNKRTINGQITTENIELNTAELGLLNQYVGLTSQVSGTLTAEGPLSSPLINSKILLNKYEFFDPNSRKGTDIVNKSFGPATIEMNSKNGNINIDLCASLKDSVSCTENSAIVLNLSGPFGFDKYSLSLHGKLNHTNFEDVILPLKKEFISLGTIANLDGWIKKEPFKPLNYKINVNIDQLFSSFPSIPNISLISPVSLSISNDEIKFAKDAILQFSPGELAVGGRASSSELDVHAAGEIPLILSRLFVPMIQSADGLASGDLRIYGKKDALMLEGTITPKYGSTFSLRKWLEPIRVKEGSIIFEKTSISSFKSKFNNIRLSVGDGKISLNGDILKQYKFGKLNDFMTFDIDTQGSNVVIRDGLNFVETDFKIHTVQKSNNMPILEGNLAITDGSAHRQFDLRNFVAQTQSNKVNAFKFFEDAVMQINLKVDVRQFRASASMLNIDIDANLRGQLLLDGPLSKPKLKGALAFNDGSIKFPATSFDLVNSQIVLDDTSPKVFDPKIDIVAIEELRKSDYMIKEDTTVELSLRGNLDKLNLELRPLQGDRSLSQLKIFMLLLSPRNSDFGGQNESFAESDPFKDIKQGARQAAMAFSGEVFLRPLTNELQELMEGATKTRIQFGSSLDPGGFTFRMNWKLGPRIELQGSYVFSNNSDKPIGGMKTEDTDLGDLKLKLLLFDHKPWGPLSLESSFGTVRRKEQNEEIKAKMGLRYRILNR